MEHAGQPSHWNCTGVEEFSPQKTPSRKFKNMDHIRTKQNKTKFHVVLCITQQQLFLGNSYIWKFIGSLHFSFCKIYFKTSPEITGAKEWIPCADKDLQNATCLDEVGLDYRARMNRKPCFTPAFAFPELLVHKIICQNFSNCCNGRDDPLS